MRREPPDSRFYGEIRDLNLAFLELVSAARQTHPGAVFGLDSAIVAQLSRFNASQLEAVAAAPCLLAGFAAGRPARFHQRVAEPPPDHDPEWAGKAGLFAVGLLTYVWQTARSDDLRAALCAGPAATALSHELRFADIHALAARALLHVEARFAGRSRFWPDLVRAARDGNEESIRLARLTAIQLATSEAGRGAGHISARIPPRLAPATGGMR